MPGISAAHPSLYRTVNRAIWFFKVGSFSHVNDNIRAILQHEFPQHPLRVIDVASDILRGRRFLTARCLMETLRMYPREILGKRRKPTDFLLRTPSAFHAIQHWSRENVRANEVSFTFQTQSLFDASGADVPHFVYTDQTCLANRRYPLAVNPELLDERWLAVERTVYESARVTFTTSSFAIRSLAEDYGVAESRASCVLSGTNVPIDEPTKKEFGGVVLFVGVDWQRKGGPDLVKAFEKLLLSHPSARLRIVGCTPRVDHPRIEVLGRVPLAKMTPHFREADIFCMPSYHEPSAVALVEAMCHGLPVVSTRVGGTPDRCIHGETGLLVEAGNVEALASALGTLLADPARCRSMGEAGRTFARNRFSWETVGRKIADRIRDEIAI